MRLLLTAATFYLVLAIQAPAQEPPVRADTQATTSGNTEPVPVPVPTAQAMEYYRSGNILWVIDQFWGILIPVLLLFTGLSARIRSWAQKVGKRWFWVIGIYCILFNLITFMVSIPLGYYEEFVRPHAYDLSNQTFGKWAGDAVKSLMVDLVIGVLFLWIPYLLLKKSRKRWWLYLGILDVPFLFLLVIVTPIWISPLFNDFGPMKDRVLEQKILSLASKAGIEGSRIFEVNKSVDTKELDAYVNGFMHTKRIVLWDTIIEKMNEQELLFVMGHEMGHYALGHVWKMILGLSVLALASLYVAYCLAEGCMRRCKGRFGFDALSDVASLPLLLLLVNLFLLVIMPITNWYSRSMEHEADVFGLEITRNNHAAATAFVKLQQENLDNPRPGLLYKLWRSDHPVLGDRIDFCNEYKPWEKGKKLEFEQYFKK